MTPASWIWVGVWIVALLIMTILIVVGPREWSDDARDVLRARYAHGELSETEFRHALEILDDPVLRAR